ncbi:hypothetical protein ACFQ1S_37485, partial [Kibdelosporangium lantanae]
DAHPDAIGCVLGGHGITAWGATSAECQANSLEIIRTAERYLADHGHPEPFGPVLPGYEPLPTRPGHDPAGIASPEEPVHDPVRPVHDLKHGTNETPQKVPETAAQSVRKDHSHGPAAPTSAAISKRRAGNESITVTVTTTTTSTTSTTVGDGQVRREYGTTITSTTDTNDQQHQGRPGTTTASTADPDDQRVRDDTGTVETTTTNTGDHQVRAESGSTATDHDQQTRAESGSTATDHDQQTR